MLDGQQLVLHAILPWLGHYQTSYRTRQALQLKHWGNSTAACVAETVICELDSSVADNAIPAEWITRTVIHGH